MDAPSQQEQPQALLTGSPTRAFGLSGGGGPQLGYWTRTAFLKELAEQREIERGHGSGLLCPPPVTNCLENGKEE